MPVNVHVSCVQGQWGGGGGGGGAETGKIGDRRGIKGRTGKRGMW